MYTIAVLNQKGGTGKTTISVHLARNLQVEGHNVLLVDSDPQGTARDWAAAREEQPLTVVGIDRPTLDRDTKNLGARDFIIIDGAPQLSEMATSAIKAANLVLIPVQPSPYDLWATAELVDKVKQRIEITDGALKAAFIVSRVIVGTKIGKEIFEILVQYKLPVLNSTIAQRVIFPISATKGWTVLDFEPKSQAAQEIRALTSEVLQFIGEELYAQR
jgi:chromosome partitioning protein